MRVCVCVCVFFGLVIPVHPYFPLVRNAAWQILRSYKKPFACHIESYANLAFFVEQVCECVCVFFFLFP